MNLEAKARETAEKIYRKLEGLTWKPRAVKVGGIEKSVLSALESVVAEKDEALRAIEQEAMLAREDCNNSAQMVIALGSIQRMASQKPQQKER